LANFLLKNSKRRYRNNQWIGRRRAMMKNTVLLSKDFPNRHTMLGTLVGDKKDASFDI
jgi:hypothetical protein